MQITKSKLTFILSGLLSLGLGMNAQAQEAAKTMSAPNDAVAKRLAPSANLEEAKVKFKPMDSGNIAGMKFRVLSENQRPSEFEMTQYMGSILPNLTRTDFKFLGGLEENSFLSFISKIGVDKSSLETHEKRIVNKDNQKILDAAMVLLGMPSEKSKEAGLTEDKANDVFFNAVITNLLSKKN